MNDSPGMPAVEPAEQAPLSDPLLVHTRRSLLPGVAVVLLVALGLYWARQYNYLLFHALVELFSITVGWGVFIVAWNARRWMRSRYFLILGISIGAASILDLFHTLAYQGMGVFPQTGANLPTQLWIAARSLQSLSMLAAPLFLGAHDEVAEADPAAEAGQRRGRSFDWMVALVFLLAVAAALALIFSGNFPDCYMEGVGLTPFKKTSEYFIILALGLSLALLWHKRAHFNRLTFRLLVAMTALAILSEFSFTLYVGVYDTFNLIGHFLKVAAYFLLYMAVIHQGFQQPLGLLFRDLSARTLALQQSEHYLNTILQTAGEGFVVTDLDARIVDVNRAYCAMSGFEREELVGMHVSDLDIHDTPEEIRARTQHLRAEGSALFETLHCRKDGSMFAVQVSTTYIPVDGGRLVSFCRDITERKRAENIQAARSRLLQMPPQATLDELLQAAADEVEQITGCQTVFFHLLEPDQAAISLQTWSANTLKNMRSDSRERFVQALVETPAWADCLQSRRPVIHNTANPPVDQAGAFPDPFSPACLLIVPVVRANAVRAVLGGGNRYDVCDENDLEVVAGLADLAWEIVENKRNQEALRASQEDLSSLIGNLPGFVYRCANDRDWTMQLISEGCLGVTGYAPEELLGNRKLAYNDIVHPDFQAEIWEKWQVCLEERVAFEFEYPILHPGGETRWVWERGQGRYGPNGQVLFLEGFITDVTERRQAEGGLQAARLELEELLAVSEQSRRVLLSLIEDQKEAEEQVARLNRELEERVQLRTAQLAAANRELEAFSYSVSHDLRAPLRAIAGFSEAVNTGYAALLDEEGQHYLERIQESARRMGKLIDDLLNFSRLTRMDVNPQPVDLSQAAREIADTYVSQEPTRRIDVDILDGLLAEGDAALLKIVLENLISNAVKFTGGKEQAIIKIGAQMQEGKPVFFVQDNGAGFSMEYAHKLFVPFQRLHTPQEFPGTGIGLSIVQRIIHRHGGRIWVEAKPGEGATFFFTLGGKDAT